MSAQVTGRYRCEVCDSMILNSIVELPGKDIRQMLLLVLSQ